MARKRKPGAVLASTLAAAACGPSAHRPSPSAVQPASDPASAFARDAVFDDHFARRTLYTWTTAEQIEELRAGKPLLSRDESPDHGGSYVEQVLEALAQRREPTAQLLFSTGYAKSRFAWPAPWATRAGWPGEQYGDQLVRITLRREAIILSLSTATGAFTARDAADGPISLDAARAAPGRIAALYFVSDAVAPPAAGVPAPKQTYREYIVLNEAMVESWSAGDDDIAHELATEADALDDLAARVRATPPGRMLPLGKLWASSSARLVRPEDAFAAALAFDNELYRLDPEKLERIAKLLRATPRTHASGRGAGTFAVGAPRAKPRVVPRPGSTWAGTFGTP